MIQLSVCPSTLAEGFDTYPEKMAQRELKRFSEEKSLAHNLIDHSFLSDDLKKQYKQSMSFRCQMLTF